MRTALLVLACLALTVDAHCVDETARWQGEIDRVAANGGGLVVIPPGMHEVGQLNLRGGVELHLSEGAELLGLPGEKNYTKARLQFSEGDGGAVIFAHGVTNVAITGRGIIDGRGGLWPHSGFRPRGIFFADSANIRLEDFTLRDAAGWGVFLKRCDGAIVRRITVDNHANNNNDGIDIEARNVCVTDSVFDSGDDAICIKSNDPDYAVENILVSNCVAASHCNGLKLGTASHGTMRNIRFVACRTRNPHRNYLYREGEMKGKMAFFWQASDEFPLGIGNGAINVECVDGGAVEDVLFDGVEAEGFRVPIFVRGNLRRHRSNGILPSDRRVLRDVTIRNVCGTACSEFPSTITGAAGCEPKNVILENVRIKCRGDALDGSPVCEPSALYDGFYPDASMFKFLRLPAYGLYIDRADVKCKNVRFFLAENAVDNRPAIYTSTPESQSARARLSGFGKSLELPDALAENGLDEVLSSQAWEAVFISVSQHVDEADKAFMSRVFSLTEKIRLLAPQAAVFLRTRGTDAAYKGLESSPYGFRIVADDYHRPETWFHLIGGNVSKAGITADLEAIKAAGFGGIQFFHGETEGVQVPDSVETGAHVVGDERDVLEVCINGRCVTKLWCPPYVCIISDMAVVGENEIEVVRTGTWQKRLQYDRALPVEHRMTWIP